jgi:hypothetical protein
MVAESESLEERKTDNEGDPRSELGIQMIYAAIYYLLLAARTDDRFSIDHLRRKNSSRLHAGTK